MSNKENHCVVIGAGGQARVVISILKSHGSEYSLQGILDTRPPDLNEVILDTPVIGSIDELDKFFKNGNQTAFLAIGESQQRSELFVRCFELGYKLPNLVSPTANIDSTANIGEANCICSFAHIGPEAQIGDNNIINTGAIVEHEVVIGDHNHLSPKSVVCGRSQIGSQIFVGAGSTVIDKIRIESGNTIGAGSVVVKDIVDSGGTYVGSPAKPIGKK